MEKSIILAVDDNAVNLATIEQTLEEEYDVIPMIEGARAIKYLNRAQADLMLLDIQMPEMDGIQTLEEIRKLDNGKTLPVIFLTAADDEHMAQLGNQMGIMDYIVKPFDGADLKRRIQKVLERTDGDVL